MSGLSLSAVSLLFPSTGTDAGSSLIGIIYGSGTGSSGSINPVTSLAIAEATQTKGVAVTAKQPANARAISDFKAAIATAKTPAQLASDPRFLKVFLTANGMSDQLGFTALASKALLSDLTKTNSLANTLTDTRYKTIAKTANLAATGLATLQNASVQQTIIDGYATQQWQTAQDAITPGLSYALAFRAQASSVKTADQILASSALRTVVQTTLNIPQEIAYQGLPEQELAITNRLDLKKLQDPKFVENFARQYLITTASNAQPTAAADITTLSVQAASLFA